MIYPTVSEILGCVNQTLRDSADESVSRNTVKSALATARHLIRHADLRMRLEKSILLDDIEKAGQTLQRVAAYLAASGSDREGLAGIINAVLVESPQLQSAAADEAERILKRALALRELVYSALKHLQMADAQTRATAAYQEVRAQLREYMRYQIAQEATMITPAFLGHGPRR